MSRGIKLIIAAVLVIVVAIGGFALFHTNNKSQKQPVAATSSTTANTSSTSPPATEPSSGATGNNFTIHANDSNADKEVVAVSKGSKVAITFSVATDGVYHGGLQFKSTNPAIDSGPIAPGQSKTVSFTADHSFSFTPYWYASQIKKDYQIQVQVQ